MEQANEGRRSGGRERGSTPVMSNEDEVPLIMEGDGSSSLELWVVWEEGSEHPCHRVTQPCREVV